MFTLFDETSQQDVIKNAIEDIQSIFIRNQVLLNCLKQVKKLTLINSNDTEKRLLIESFLFNPLTTQSILNYSLETIDKLILEITRHQNQISMQHHAFISLKEHHSIHEQQNLCHLKP